MQQPDLPATFVTVEWRETPDGWAASVLFAGAEGYERLPLHPGTEVDWEVTSDRRCTGYRRDDGQLQPCPETAVITTGDQCNACRARDVSTSYVEGRAGAGRSGDHSVYLAQVGTVIKVGVTRTSRLLRRWVEQGAAYGVEVDTGLSADAALRREAELVDAGFQEAVRAEASLPVPQSPDLEAALASHELSPVGNVINVWERTIYPKPACQTTVRTGRVSGQITSVFGQLIEVDELCLAVTGGRRVITPKQTALTEY